LMLGLIFASLLAMGCQSTVVPPAVTTTAVALPAAATSLPTATQLAATVPPTATASLATPQVTAEPETVQASSATPLATPTETALPSLPVDQIALLPILEGAFVRPLYLTHAGDDRLFVVEEAGVIYIVRDGQLLQPAFLDIRDRVNSAALERGLLGLAFHPQYQENGVFFVNYSNANGDTQISRFRVSATDPNAADPSSETLLLTIDQPYENHNGGQLAFGPDGYLYIGVGDGGSANDPLLNGQNPGTLLGSILRIEVDAESNTYSIPPSNPFIDDPQRLDEIWAWGLRNPWRFSFDRLSGDLFIADVGQNLWEEVDFQPAASAGGENYGWNIMEGMHCFLTESCESAGLTIPIFEYSHSEGCSITGGYIYRGMAQPALYGNYLVGDYCQGRIWRLFPNSDGSWSSAMVLDTTNVISSFGEDSAGELYILDHVTGSLYQITQ
ncbi:MAG: PQQ-dependent sugar dehydrogenase, partial [Candidatus Promineifilaceae bacterium]